MSSNEAQINTYLVHIANIIARSQTWIDFAERISRNLGGKPSSFWDTIIQALLDKIVIESHKLIDKDKKVVSLFSLITKLKRKFPSLKDEICRDERKLLLIRKGYTPKRLRDNWIAHLNVNGELDSLHVDFNQVVRLLEYSETLHRKYYKWVKGERPSIGYASIFAEGHNSILEEIDRILQA